MNTNGITSTKWKSFMDLGYNMNDEQLDIAIIMLNQFKKLRQQPPKTFIDLSQLDCIHCNDEGCLECEGL